MCQENAGAAKASRVLEPSPRLASPRHVSYTTVKDYKIILSYGRVSADRIRPIILVTMVKEKVTVNEVTSKNHSSPGKEIVKKLFLLLCEATSQASRILLHLTKIPTQNQSHPANKTKPFNQCALINQSMHAVFETNQKRKEEPTYFRAFDIKPLKFDLLYCFRL